MPKKLLLLIFTATLYFPAIVCAQHLMHHDTTNQSAITNVAPQPLLAQAIRLKEALSFLGSSLSSEDEKRLSILQSKPLTQQVANEVQAILDPYCLAFININPEARVKVERGPAKAKL